MIHLHDILGMKINDYELERQRIEVLFKKTKFHDDSYYGLVTYKDVVDQAFSTSRIRGTAISLDDFMNQCAVHWKKPSLDALLFYCEVVFNVVMSTNDDIRYHTTASRLADQMLGNIFRILEKTGYDLQKGEDGIYFVAQKNAVATDVIQELDDKHLALAILEYNRFSMKGEIERKRELLNVIGQAVEPILKDATAKARSPEVFDDVRFALNRLNIRHNNVAGANEQPALKKLSKEALETAYDDLYSSMLVLLKISQLKEGHARMDALKKQMTKA